MTNNEIELAWAAGFFDGEGCSYKASGYPYVSIGQIHTEVLERFQKAVGFGNIHGPYIVESYGPNAHPRYEYSAPGRAGIEVMEKILPYLSSVKVDQWKSVLDGAIIPARFGYCMKDLHEMTDDNTDTEGRCKICRRASANACYHRNKGPVRSASVYKGKTIREWFEDPRCVVSYSCMRWRITQKDWDPVEAITTPQSR